MEEKSLKILAIQMSSILGDRQANFKKVQELIDKNFCAGTDLIILPEVWTVGWKPSLFIDSAEEINNSETIKFLSKIAQKYQSHVIGGSFIARYTPHPNPLPQVGREEYAIFSKSLNLKDNNRLSHAPAPSRGEGLNTCPVINKNGELISVYNKMHLFSYYGCEEGKYVQRGQNPVLIEISGVKIGLSLCYDIRFPEIYRAYRLAGADVLVNMAAWPLSRPIHWESLTKARAIENQCFMVALTQSGLIENDEWNLGHSRIIDYKGEVISEITQGEGAMCTKLEFNEIYEFRNKCSVVSDICEKYVVKTVCN